jgi:DNA-binding XRE family transcriptional regulator
MTPQLIKSMLRERKITLTSIAKHIGVSKQAVSIIIDRRQTSRRIAQGVADALTLPLDAVFPEYAAKEHDKIAACQL